MSQPTTTQPTTAQPTSTDVAALEAMHRRWADAFNAGDVEAMMSVYEPDAVIVPGPGAEPVAGLAAIEGSLRWFLGLGGRIESGPSRYWTVNGDLALGSIAWVVVGGRDPDTGAPVELAGVTAEVVRRQADGSWRYVIDDPFGAGA